MNRILILSIACINGKLMTSLVCGVAVKCVAANAGYVIKLANLTSFTLNN